MIGTWSAGGAVARLLEEARMEAAEASSSAEVLVGACVHGGASREWAEALVAHLGEAIAARPPYPDADRARHDAERVDPLRAEIARRAAPVLIRLYERAVIREQEALDAYDGAVRATILLGGDRRTGD